jgi:predicted metal-dependent enzyme (double-stranded beta helix superfamily)
MFDWDDFVDRCRSAGAETDPVAAVTEVVAEAVVDRDVMTGIVPMTGTATLFCSPELTVQRIVWPGGVLVAPHEHRMWAVVGVCQGQEDNELWERGPTGVARVGARELAAGEVMALGVEAIHSIANPRKGPTIGLHVYGGDITTVPRSEWDLEGGNEHPFDVAAVETFVAAMIARTAELGRPVDFDEVRQACLGLYDAPSR